MHHQPTANRTNVAAKGSIDMDTDEIHKLLDIAEKTLKWPHLKPMHDRAMELLRRKARSMGVPDPEPVPVPEPIKPIPIEPPITGQAIRRVVDGLPGPAEAE